jgi:glutamyl-tRNA reductase
MGKLEGIFVYDIDDLQQVAAAHMAERGREAAGAEALIAVEVERFHQHQRAVNVSPAIVALQQQAEEIRQVELHRAQSRLGALSAEQIAAIEALTRGLVNKFLHPPMQALKQAARENDAARVEALCEAWSLPAGTGPENEVGQMNEQNTAAVDGRVSAGNCEAGKAEGAEVNQGSGAVRP